MVDEGLPYIEGEKDPAHEVAKIHHFYHYFETDYTAGERWEKREETINEWMNADRSKDQQLEDARLIREPPCQHCGKTGLRIISKDLMHRGEHYKLDDPEEVLILLSCPHCNKKSAYWHDGVEWERLKTYCPKCKSVMKESSKRKAKIIKTMYTCGNCDHTYSDTLDLATQPLPEQKIDLNFERDKARFCFDEKRGHEFLDEKRRIQGMAELGKKMREKEDNKELYEAAASIKKLTIAPLAELLKPAIEKAGYVEFSLDKPEMGKDVQVGFNCLDSKSDRDDYESRRTLKKLVDKTLKDTNWRLMSDGISYRLGYLTGRVLAYEKEEDLLKLVTLKKRL
jgi:hypothetical protein